MTDENNTEFAKSLAADVVIPDSHFDHLIDGKLTVDAAGITLSAVIPGIPMKPWQRDVFSNVFFLDVENDELVVRDDLFVMKRRTGPSNEWLARYEDSLCELTGTFLDQLPDEA